MLKIGLTGGIASGKTTVSSLFYQLGAPIIDADILARELTRIGSPALSDIIDHFGHTILYPNGSLNRSALRTLMFTDLAAKQQLESILHPKIRTLLQQRSDALSSPYCILVIPLLVEAKMIDLVDRVVAIETDPSIQKKRLQQRDNIDLSLIESMIESQTDITLRRKIADDIIDNSGDITRLQTTVNSLHQHYLAQAKLHSPSNSSKLS